MKYYGYARTLHYINHHARGVARVGQTGIGHQVGTTHLPWGSILKLLPWVKLSQVATLHQAKDTKETGCILGGNAIMTVTEENLFCAISMLSWRT